MSDIFDKVGKFLSDHGVLDKQVQCPKCKQPDISIIIEGEDYTYAKHLTRNGKVCIASGKPLEVEDGDVIDAEFIDHDS